VDITRKIVEKGLDYMIKSTSMRKKRKTRRDLINVATDLFAKKGYDGTSVRDIAKVTGMTVYNTYYHFGSKDGLLLAVLSQLSTELLTNFGRVNELDLPPLDRFKELLKTHLEGIIRNKRRGNLLFLDENVLTPAANKHNKQFQLDILDIYRRELQSLQNAGYLRSKNITVLAFNVLGSIQWHFRWYKPKGRLSFDEVIDEAISYILNGILRNSRKKNV
jgi:TetR/AcrR family transcriptional regulator, cholesterol catabolism regulator